MKKHKVIIFLPSYNAEKTLYRTFKDIPKNIADKIILRDDGSNDHTVELAKKLKLTIYKSKINKGYGANHKSCYDIALKLKATIVVMLHADYQYDPRLIPYLIDFIKNDYFDIMLGSRIRTRTEALKGGMPVIKYYANRFLSFIQNIVTGQNLSEWHTGYHAYSAKALKSIPYHSFSNDFIFATQILMAFSKKGFRIGDIPVPVRYFPESSSINIRNSIKYAILTIIEAIKYVLQK